jgi:hypothetical protein
MRGLTYINAIREYLDHLEDHLLKVGRAWQQMKPMIRDLIPARVMCLVDLEVDRHDLSQFSEEEFCAFREHLYPVEGDRKNVGTFGRARAHHAQHNPHHWENWTMSSDSEDRIIHMIHMLIDWCAKGNQNEHWRSVKGRMVGHLRGPEWGLIDEILRRMG